MATKKTKPKTPPKASEYEIARTDDEIDDLLNQCSEAIDSGESAFEGQTYEQGVQAAIDWLTGRTEEHPLPEED